MSTARDAKVVRATPASRGLDDRRKPIEIDGVGDIVIGPEAAAFELVVAASQSSEEMSGILLKRERQFVQ